jgi:hypothetical protein
MSAVSPNQKVANERGYGSNDEMARRVRKRREAGLSPNVKFEENALFAGVGKALEWKAQARDKAKVNEAKKGGRRKTRKLRRKSKTRKGSRK